MLKANSNFVLRLIKVPDGRDGRKVMLSKNRKVCGTSHQCPTKTLMHVQATQHDEATPVRFHVSQYLRIVRENRRISKSRFHPCSYGRVFCKPDVISRNKPDKPMYLINSSLNIERLKLLFDPMLSISNIGNLLLPHRY